MAELDGTSYWKDSATVPRFASLERDLEVDVAIVGAGITGLTAAYYMIRDRIVGPEAKRCESWDAVRGRSSS